jgi:hypothetical protein
LPTRPILLKGDVMSKEIIYKLKYRDGGERKFIDIKIDFVSNYVIREYNNLISSTTDVKIKWDKVMDITNEIEKLRTDKPEGYKVKVESLRKDVVSISDEIMKHQPEGLLDKRFDIIKVILDDNGIKDESLLSFEFWDRKVEPQDIMEFLTFAVYKDIDKKKL